MSINKIMDDMCGFLNEGVFFGTGIGVAAISDIILNDLSRFKQSGAIINSLRPYFDNKPILLAAAYAALTIFCAMVVVSIIFRIFFGSFYPRTFVELFIYCVIAYPIGFGFDKIIDKFNIFGSSLKPYYKVAGSGHWGAIAFIVAIVPAFFTSFAISHTRDEIKSCIHKVKKITNI